MADEKKIALFIDADNISAKYGKLSMETLQSRGEIFIRRIYGNWEKNFLHKWNDCILRYGLLAVQQMDFTAGKNATDMSLAIDAMDVLYQKQATVFAIVTGDSDFTPLAVRLRERGVYVISLGIGQTSASLRSACNEFIDLDALMADDIRADEVQDSQENIEIEKNQIAETKKTEPDAPVKSDAKSSVPTQKKSAAKKISPGKPAKDKNRRKVSNDESKKNSGDNVKVELAPETPAPTAKIISGSAKKMTLSERFIKCGQNGMRKPKKKLQQIHDALRESAEVHADEKGFSPLNCAGHDLKQKNLGFGIKDFGYTLLHEFISDFPQLYELVRTKSRSFRYRCR